MGRVSHTADALSNRQEGGDEAVSRRPSWLGGIAATTSGVGDGAVSPIRAGPGAGSGEGALSGEHLPLPPTVDPFQRTTIRSSRLHLIGW